MIRTTHFMLLSCLMTGTAVAAPALPVKQDKGTEAAASSGPAMAQLRAMPTVRLLKLGDAALKAQVDSPAFSTGLDALQVASSRGDRAATRLLAKVMARHEVSIEGANRGKIESKLRYEAMRGASSSVLAIAGMYDRGEGVPVDVKKATDWYLWAARVGNKRARAHVAYAYGAGRGVERSEETALKWLDAVNDGRTRITLVEIGWALATGAEGEADMPAALRYFERAAQIKPYVAYQVAMDLERGTNGVQDREAAGHLIKVAADRGDTAAATHLANMLAGSDKVEDQRQAVQWYTLAAQDKENVAAGQGLSRLLALRSKSEIVPDIVAGLEKAAAAGNQEALIGLAQAYSDGTGVSAAPEKAASLLQQAADAGIPEAKYRLGLMYKSGTGVGANLNKAIELMSSAQESGFPLAAVALSSMTEPTATSSVGEQLTPKAAETGTVVK
ncbi:tetratricopeptide repeat protein [Microvirga sp. P5_D2]